MVEKLFMVLFKLEIMAEFWGILKENKPLGSFWKRWHV
jgi:hypothetical protein